MFHNIFVNNSSFNASALFLSNKNKRISLRTVQYIFEKYRINVHALRHTFITRLIRNGEDISIFQALSGHFFAKHGSALLFPNR
ncbi:MAG: tyrosine-type recombinase/integrase [Anoxybacillus sp.]|nr:tyrosine-type recombinase/integrase [Anoxybacillus sp.]